MDTAANNAYFFTRTNSVHTCVFSPFLWRPQFNNDVKLPNVKSYLGRENKPLNTGSLTPFFLSNCTFAKVHAHFWKQRKILYKLVFGYAYVISKVIVEASLFELLILIYVRVSPQHCIPNCQCSNASFMVIIWSNTSHLWLSLRLFRNSHRIIQHEPYLALWFLNVSLANIFTHTCCDRF